jgi:N-acylneuraminate cytidylyltransferase
MRVALIPARGGSKRIPRKNVLPFAGKPIIGHVIDRVRSCGLFDRVVVSTDDSEVAAVARTFGADVPFERPSELADDHTGTIEVVRHAVTCLQDDGIDLSEVCCLYPTAPFVMAEDLEKGLQILEAGSWHFVFSATTFPHPPARGFRQNPDGGLSMYFPEHFTTRSQDLPEALHDAGQFYWGSPAAWLKDRTIFGERSTVVRVPRWRVQDIDTPEDWERAEQIWKLMGLEDPER